MQVPASPPEPAAFGLNPEKLRGLDGSATKNVGEKVFQLSLVLSGLSALVVALLLSPGRDDSAFWPRFFVASLLIGAPLMGLAKLIEAAYGWFSRQGLSREDWTNFATYGEACGRYAKWLEERRQHEIEERRAAEEASRRREEWWKSLDGYRFEREFELLLKGQGYSVSRTGGAGDEGIDLVIRRANQTIIVQCKAHKALVGPGPVRELYGALMHRGADGAWLVAVKGFTSGARSFAAGKPIKLLTIREILRGLST